MRHWTVRASTGLRSLLAIGAVIVSVAASPWGQVEAREGNRTLKLFFGHTGERGEFTFKRNGRYDRAEVARINRFLRDWRRNEPAKMDPQLFDLIWSIYKETGSREYVHVVSAYRSLATNDMLRKRSRGVASKSQHTAGKAMDFYIPGVPLAKLRGIAMKHQGGGVGYYPTSGSPFVHVDTGNVRSWPRMSRQQLIALFPDGDTLYLPADGKPLPGYERALARKKSGGTTALAYLETGSDDVERGGARGGTGNGNVGGWLKRVFTDDDEAEDTEAAAAKPPKKPEAPAEPAAEPAPAVGDPTILLAEPDPDMRVPRSRPAPPAAMLAAIAPTTDAIAEMATAAIPAGEIAAAAVEGQVASLAFAPLPRSRPDAGLLVASLGDARSALNAPAPDAIAALETMSEGAPQRKPAAPVQVALLPSQDDHAPIDPADRAILAGFAAIEDVDTTPSPAIEEAAAILRGGTVPLPRARPVALAFAGTGLRPAAEEEVASVKAALPAPAPQASAAPAAIHPAAVKDSTDSAALGSIITAATPSEPAVRDLGESEPAAAPGLFAVPDTVDSVMAAKSWAPPPTGHFEPPAPTAPPAKESFFSRLFASLAN